MTSIILIVLALMLIPLVVVYIRFPWEEYRQRKEPGFKVSKISVVAFGYAVFSVVWINLSTIYYFLTHRGNCFMVIPRSWGIIYKILKEACDGIMMFLWVVSGIDILLFPIAGIGLSIAAAIIIKRNQGFRMRNLGKLSWRLSFYLFFVILFDLLVMGMSNMH